MYNENGYDATLTACVNYWAMTDPKLTHLPMQLQDIYFLAHNLLYQ